MLKLICNVSRRGLVLGALVLCFATATAWALTVQVPLLFPGVDAGGNLSDGLGTQSVVNVNINTQTGKFRASGKATVRNLSGAKQTFLNAPVDIPGVTVTSSRYSVSKKGAAMVAAAGTALGTAAL